MSVQLIFNIVILFSLILLIGTSFSLIYFSSKTFSIFHAAVITIAAYFTYMFNQKLGFPMFLSIVFAIPITAFIGMIPEIIVFKKHRAKQNSPIYSLVSSIGLYLILQNIISIIWNDNPKSLRIGDIIEGHHIFGAYITTVQIITILVAMVLFIVMNLFLHYTTTGKSIRAVSSNPELCNIYGINSNKIILIAFIIGSTLAATVGILSAFDTNITPTFGFNLLLYGIVAMIIGGVGSTKGLIIGSLLVASAQYLAAYYLDTKWMDAVTYIILILFLIWKPLGFSGKLLKKVEV